MYKQFSYSNFIQTNERNHKLLFNKNSKLPPLIIKKTTQITNDVINKNKEKNWKQSHKRLPYFSKPYYLISKIY